jgi:hypothetical protein
MRLRVAQARVRRAVLALPASNFHLPFGFFCARDAPPGTGQAVPVAISFRSTEAATPLFCWMRVLACCAEIAGATAEIRS